MWMLTRGKVFFFGRKHGLSAEQVPVSAYIGSSKNLKDLKRVLGGFILYRRAFEKSKNGFVKQNRKLVYKCGFRFWVCSSEQAKLCPRISNNSGFEAQILKNRVCCSTCSDTCAENLRPHSYDNFRFFCNNVVSEFPNARRKMLSNSH